MGDPAGVGPEICLKLLADQPLSRVAVPIVLGSRAILERTSRELGLPLDAKCLESGEEKINPPKQATVVDVAPEWGGDVLPGQISGEAGRAAYRYIEYAVRGTLDRTFDAIVTAPINKKSLHEGGIEFPGHTEIVAALTQTPESYLMLWSPKITVAMVTLHVGLDRVGPLIRKARIERVISLTHGAK